MMMTLNMQEFRNMRWSKSWTGLWTHQCTRRECRNVVVWVFELLLRSKCENYVYTYDNVAIASIENSEQMHHATLSFGTI